MRTIGGLRNTPEMLFARREAGLICKVHRVALLQDDVLFYCLKCRQRKEAESKRNEERKPYLKEYMKKYMREYRKRLKELRCKEHGLYLRFDHFASTGDEVYDCKLGCMEMRKKK